MIFGPGGHVSGGHYLPGEQAVDKNWALFIEIFEILLDNIGLKLPRINLLQIGLPEDEVLTTHF